jgi:hypothetical protein
MTATWPANPLEEPPATVAPEQARFREDVRWAIGVCRRHPLLPLMSLLIGLAPLVADAGRTHRTHGATTVDAASSGQQGLGVLVAVVVVVLLGWPGTQRLWFLRAASDRSMAVGEALRVTLRYFGRFFVLGLLVFAVSAVVFVPLVVSTVSHMERGADGSVTTPNPGLGYLIAGALVMLVLDVLLTFVTPALVFTSHHVGTALRVGLKLLRLTWPHTALYVMVPPLAAVLVSLYSDLSPAVSVPLVAASTLVNLVVKGATAAVYQRVMPSVGVDGALVLPPPSYANYAPGRDAT